LRLYLKYEDPAVAYPWGFNLYMKMNSVFGIVFATVMDANLIKVLYTLIENWVLARSSGAIKLTE
jgi:hypothetical protein